MGSRNLLKMYCSFSGNSGPIQLCKVFGLILFLYTYYRA
ncbi:hypothetical protein Patl1_07107 [Pistacia atlantica]|uniref:Uncharacterized protein n=1 Tax=Pistacia atlantica TaxID=434234 RepID=A0ACC1AH82_9ROSI|nr:hypothetical protein Patl1_07107 [Pistacia atlantica]